MSWMNLNVGHRDSKPGNIHKGDMMKAINSLPDEQQSPVPCANEKNKRVIDTTTFIDMTTFSY